MSVRPIQADIFSYRPDFDGTEYERGRDHARLTGQIERVYALMVDGIWRTLREITEVTGDPESSVSAQLRNLRKPRFGAHRIEKRRRGDGGTWEYRLAQ